MIECNMSYIICPIIFKNLDIQTEIIYLFQKSNKYFQKCSQYR